MEQEPLNTNKPIVAIVGRPNVGKSTLYNRLTGNRYSIVSDESGTTRDRVITNTSWGDKPFTLIDTGGIDLFESNILWNEVRNQIDDAIRECDVIILLVDISIGITNPDREVAEMIRLSNKPVVLAASKSDNTERALYSSELYELGLGNPIPISAYHNFGIEDLMEQVINFFPDYINYPEPEVDLNLAIVGRTNVGKSMLLNSISGKERSIVSDVPGTTRDSIDTTIRYKDRDIKIIDTAGIRRRGKIEVGIEKYSVLRSVKAINRSEVACLVLDVSELATSQDTHISNYILESYKGMMIVINKWDLSKKLERHKNEIKNEIKSKFKFASYAPICFTSGLNSTGIEELLDTALHVQTEWSKGIPRPDIRRTILDAVAEHPPANSGKRELKIYSAMQDNTMPPSFTFFVNHSDMVHFSYKRYLENCIRSEYKFDGAPLKIRFKGWKG